MQEYDSIVIGGGFFGCSVALKLASQKKSVLLIEESSELLTRASYKNQARVHGGYHYPRSFLTANRSRVNFKKFNAEYSDSIVSNFKKYYAISNKFSNVSALQFKEFCTRLDAPIKPAPTNIKNLSNSSLIEDVFEVEEFAFDAEALKRHVMRQLGQTDLKILMKTQAIKIQSQNNNHTIELTDLPPVKAKEVWICTYSSINKLLDNSSLPKIPLQHILTEIALVEPPAQIKDAGITVMDGPFFSVMPFPAKKLHSFTHVRFSHHGICEDDQILKNPPKSNFSLMKKDAVRYFPILNDCKYVQSLWELKTLMPRSVTNDSRPILFRKNHGFKGIHCILGGKIDNIFDILDELETPLEAAL